METSNRVQSSGEPAPALQTDVQTTIAQTGTPSTHAATLHSPRPLPYGVADYFWDEATRRKELEFTLFELYRRWGYTLVMPPTFEYADTFYARADAQFQTEMYRFPDKDGTMLALRPEMTIPVARLAATRLHDSPKPQRYCYMGNVFRYIEPRAGRQREFYQAGVELIGAVPPAADAEVVAVTAAAVEAAHLGEYQLVLGQLAYFNGLMHDLNLNPAQIEMLRRAIDRNSEPQLSEFLAATPLRTQQRRTLEALPDLRGNDPAAVIAQAERHCLNHRMYDALAALRNICRALDGYGLLDRIYVDLTEIHNLGYYTGLSFEVLTPATGFALGSGGRYDNLLASFGHDQPAVGAALSLDRLLHARDTQQHTSTQREPVHAQITVDTQHDPACLAYVRAWRAQGLRVAMQLETQASAPASGPRQTPAHAFPHCHITWTGSGFDVTYHSVASHSAALDADLANDAQGNNARHYPLAEHEMLLKDLTRIFLHEAQA